jgi:hypothetical protein
MKRIVVLFVMFCGLLSFNNALGQEQGVNISSQPSWGPRGYDYVEYYYFPDIGIYYNVPDRKFIYQSSSGNWTFSNTLPDSHSDYDLFTAYKIVINEPKAYLMLKKHKVKYPAIKGNRGKPLLFRKDNLERKFTPEQYLRSSGSGKHRKN